MPGPKVYLPADPLPQGMGSLVFERGAAPFWWRPAPARAMAFREGLRS